MSHSIQIALAAFSLDCRSRRLKPTTVEWYDYMLKPFLKWLDEEHQVTTLEQVTASHIRMYLLYLEENADWKDTSQHGAGRAMRAFFNFCVKEDFLVKSPMLKVKMPRQNKRILPAFTPQEVQQILGVCTSERDRALVLFMLDTGIRVQECANVQMDDIDLKTGSVFIRLGKGGKDRIVYFGDKTHKQLMKYFMELGRIPSAGEALWYTQNNSGPMARAGIQTMTKILRDRCKIPHLTPHTFRRTFAIWNLRAGMNIYELQRLMGHADLSVLERYLDLVNADIQAAHKRVGAVDKML